MIVFIIIILLFPTIIITSMVMMMMMITMAQLNSSITIWLRGSSHTPGKDREGHFLRIFVVITRVLVKMSNLKV